MITPQQIEKRLHDLSKEIDEAQTSLVKSETSFHNVTAQYEVSMAKSRMKNSESKMTVTTREDLALLENEELHFSLAVVEAEVKAARANVNRLKTQVDIARSISSSIKSSLEM